MIKKTTLLVLLGAIALGGAVYYFDWKRGQKADESGAADTSKPAFSVPTAADISSLTISRPAVPEQPAVHLEKRGGTWQMVQPMQTDADQRIAEQITSGLASARVTQTVSGAPDRLKVYGLDPPAISVEFQLQNGTKHTVKLGAKEFTGISVYAILDGAKDVALVPYSLLVNTNLNLTDFRNHAVLPVAVADVASFELKNSSGDLAAAKEKNLWKFSKPAGQLADSTDVNALLTEVANAKWAVISSETPDNLAKYGLANPAVSFSATDGKAKTFTLLVGKKEGSDYFARDASRPMIFHIGEDLYKKLSQNYAALRDKELVHFDPAAVTRVEVHNGNGTLIANRKAGKEEDWTIEAPADLKEKSAGTWKLFGPLTSARADEVLDHPSPDILAKLAKPEIEATLTVKDGKKLTVQVSKEAGDFVYARSSDRPTVYKLKKRTGEDLNFKPADFAF
jgi:Domain of unknown function (DUF4340)